MNPVTEHALGPCPGDDAVFEQMIRQNEAKISQFTARSRRDAGGGVFGEQLEALASAIEVLPAPDRVRIAEGPLFSHWSLRKTQGQATEWALQLGRLLLVPHLENKSLPSGGVYLPVGADSTVSLPGRLAITMPARHAGKVARISVAGDSLVAGSPATTVGEVPLLLRQRSGVTAGESGIEIDGSDPWTAGHLELMNQAQPVGPYPKRDISPVKAIGADLAATITESMALLAVSWPEAYAEVTRYTKLVVPFRSKYLSGWSTPLFQGAAFIRSAPGEVPFTFERLVHESAHQRLFAIQRAVRLHNDPPGKLLPSALRKDQRPTAGVYHAAFVCGRLAEAFTRAESYWPDRWLSDRKTRMTAAYLEMSRTLHAQAALTEIGEAMLARLDERVRSLT
jgi:HEXXH motif-containing protein